MAELLEQNLLHCQELKTLAVGMRCRAAASEMLMLYD
jgi:hypothetical protein